MLMYRIINNICPDYLKNYVSYSSDTSCRHTSFTNFNQLYTPTPNCELFRKSLMYSGAAIWNSLPLHIKNATSVKMGILKRPLNHYYYYCQSDSVFCTDLGNDSVFFIDLINAYFMSFILLA